MAAITVYSTMLCPYCSRARRLLKSKGVEFDVIDVTGRPRLREEMRQKAGGAPTVPQIWIGDLHVGGCDDLYELEERGELDPLLAKVLSAQP